MAHYFHPIDPFLPLLCSASEMTERLVKSSLRSPACSDLERRPNCHIAHALHSCSLVGAVGWKPATPTAPPPPPHSRGYHSIYTNALGGLQCQEAAWTFAHSRPATFSEDYWAIVRGYEVGTAFSPDRSFSLQGSLEANFIKYQVADPKQYK